MRKFVKVYLTNIVWDIEFDYGEEFNELPRNEWVSLEWEDVSDMSKSEIIETAVRTLSDNVGFGIESYSVGQFVY